MNGRESATRGVTGAPLRCLYAVLACLAPALLSASPPAGGGAAADALWAKIAGLIRESEQTVAGQGTGNAAQREEGAAGRAKKPAWAPSPALVQQVRELALEFYDTYPQDPRAAELRNAFLAGGSVHPLLPFRDAVSRIERYEQRAAQGHWNVDAEVTALLEFVGVPGNERRVSSRFHRLRLIIRSLHLTLDEQRRHYARLKASDNPELRALAAGRERFLALSEQPLELRLPVAGGGVLDLQALRGKVVLLDFWSLSCSSCIAAMPRMQALYAKYRDRGLEVVGVLLTSRDSPDKQLADMTQGARIMERQGATWADLLMAGESTVQGFMQRYSFSGVPQLWLLDQTGRLVQDVDPGSGFTASRAGESFVEREIRRLLDHDVAMQRVN